MNQVGLPAIWASTRTVAWLRGGMTLLVIAGAVILVFGPGGGWTALGVGLIGAALGATPLLASMRTEPFCAFCGRSRVEVNSLVAGPHASICDACVGTATSVVYLASEPRPDSTAGSLVETLAREAPSLDADRARRVLEAARALARTPREREAIANHALDAAEPAIAVAAIEDIAAAERSINQENLRAVALSRLGRHAEALAITAALEARSDSPDQRGLRGLILNNRTWYELESGATDLDRLRAQAEEAVRVVGAATDAPEAWRRESLAYCVGTLAHVLVRLGTPQAIEAAIAHLERHERSGGGMSTGGLLALGDAYAAGGRSDDARRTWRRVIDRAPPRSDEARKARERLGDQQA